MFNFVMGIVMIGIGSISVAHAFFSKKRLQKVYLHGNINKHSEVLE